ncbi:hypothetical protein DH2020_012410 [Rehmannia glutinosa]|uniref:NB-ARC domain-containing protein n=1 Tax=Rehmannia glutinosa TaxID=99300 RepID=A0ABR0X0Q5_REHGL
MGSYAALVSLKQTINRLPNSRHVSIQVAHKKIKSLKNIAERLNGSNESRVNAFDGQIREAACELEDALELLVSSQNLSQPKKSLYPLIFPQVKQEIDTFILRAKELKKVFNEEIVNWLTEKDDVVPSRIEFDRKKHKVVGLSYDLGEMINKFSTQWSYKSTTLSIYGMAGIGKTTLAMEIFQDPLISSQFDCRAWVTLGPKCAHREIICGILAQIDPDIDIMLIEGSDEELDEYLPKSLKDRRYFIVLDDIWDVGVMDGLKGLVPDDINGSRVLLTTRIKDVADIGGIHQCYWMTDLHDTESWCLLRELVFGEELCPPQLEKAGKKIAEKCEGHPLTIVIVADFLRKADKTPDHWNKVAEKENSVFNDAYDKMLGVLYPSYQYLPQYLKACFLYMGVFPQKYEIPLPKLFMLWTAEGFLERGPDKSTIESLHVKCLKELSRRSLVVDCQWKYNFQIKTCRLHSVFWHLCRKEARKNKFFHVVNSYADSLVEAIKNQHRLCIHKNILFGIKDVYNSMASISTARSLLCTGLHHPYPVSICLGMRFLRVLDALTIPFYEFPIDQILNLVHLRYLALTFYNGNIPSSISKLWNLQFLIVRRYLSIKLYNSRSYLPIEIWDMKELKHLQIMGSDLPDPCDETPILKNLLTLLDVSARSFTKGVVKRIPNLKKLGIRIELELDSIEPLSCFHHISNLRRLESLKCVIVNPIVAPHIEPLPNFPSGLKKLTLSGLGYPWEEMSTIASLPNLKVLKLRCYAFRGPKWEIYGEAFAQLEFLLIEDTDLVHWTVGDGGFPFLETVKLKHCYKLEEVPEEFRNSILTINLVDCNPLAVTCAKEIQKKMEQETGDCFAVMVQYSWDDKNPKPDS